MGAYPKLEKFPLVGVGASVEGLDSFQKFLQSVPANSGMAYIIVQHLSPSRESLLPKILSETSPIPILEITDNCVIEADHIYVMPEDKMLEITDYSLRLMPREAETPIVPVDVFFSSMARVHGSLAVGVLLMGTAKDGVVGLRNIKENGGITFVEGPSLDTWEAMPKNVIEAGVVDFILPPEEIPSKLMNVHAVYEKETLDVGQKPEADTRELKKIISVVQQQSGVDFSYYKRPTVLRRIDRRMAINQITSHRDYLALVSENRAEQESLFQDLLIKVTSFFRDPEVFTELAEIVFPRLLESPTNPIRIWVAGCATGEEAYSLAIALFDAMGRPNVAATKDIERKRIQLFATDISEDSIDKARKGIYAPSELQSLSQRQLNTYFIKNDGSYKVVKPIRDSIVFAGHNFLQDPPFSNIDLVSCRNVLIYLDPFLQKKALATFHYALKENGFLMLGKSETSGSPSDQFAPFSKQCKIYMRKPGKGRPVSVSTKKNKNDLSHYGKPTPSMRSVRTDFRKSAENILVSNYTPASLIVDEHMEILQINGSAAPFLEPWSGKPTHELMKMARKELAFELRNALHKAKESQQTTIKEGIPLKYDGERFLATIEVVPLTDTLDPHYLILFRKNIRHAPFLTSIWKKLAILFSVSEKNNGQRHIAALERELEQAREDMRNISEEQEAYTEELQSTNEELLSSNEEMQSLNEELETTKEEVQSTNEELIITNRELLEQREEQNRTFDLLREVISTLREPFLLLDQDMRVQMANTAYYIKFDVTEGETIGKSFFGIKHGLWKNIELRIMLGKVLPKKERIVDKEIAIKYPSGKQHSFMFNAREIIRKNKSERLILLSMEDISEKKKTQSYKDTIKELKKTNAQLDRYVHVASHDLQEPLRRIMTLSNRLIEKSDLKPEDNIKDLQKITSSAERMTILISGLLEYSRLAHHRDLFEPTDLYEVMEGILSDLDFLIEDKQAQVEVKKLPVLDGIPLQIRQLLYNLVSNALKFSKEGITPMVEVSSRPFPKTEFIKHPLLDPELSYQEIIVKDNGIGFDQKYGEQIFIIFQRLRRSRTHEGNGIGLSLVKKITENHRGTLFAVSEEGKGASFHVILPVAQP